MRRGLLVVSAVPQSIQSDSVLEADANPDDAPRFVTTLTDPRFSRVRHWKRLPDGWLGGFDHGEWGGGVWWFSVDGATREQLSDQNVHDIFAVGDETWLTVGLDHLQSRAGAVLRVSHDGGHWSVVTLADLHESANVGVAVTRNAALVATYTRLLHVSSTGKVTLLHTGQHDPVNARNFVRAPEGGVYFGGRHAVLRVDPTPNGECSLTWLASRSCASSYPLTCGHTAD